MEQVAQVKTLSMGWCLECHRHCEPQLRPQEFITKMDWIPNEDPEVLAQNYAWKTTSIHPRIARHVIGKEKRQHDTLALLAKPGRAPRCAGISALLEAEFPANDDQAGISRRRWLQLMGASLVLAGAASCRWEKREILPFDKRPANRTPGKFERFATTLDMGGAALGLMVTCVDGRPIKIEGNPKHPSSLGATNAYAQAAILELYDPDRSRNIVQKTGQGDEVKSWDEFAAFAQVAFRRTAEKRRPRIRRAFRGQHFAHFGRRA